MRFFRSLIIASVIFLASATAAAAYSNPGKPSGLVNDYAGLLSAEQRTALENKLEAFSASSTDEVAVVTIKSLDGDTIENYANKLFTDWGIGRKKEDNGVLILVAKDDHKMRIEVGYGLEGALPDATCYQIINRILTPAFKQNDYYGGLDKATDAVIAATAGEYQAEAGKYAASDSDTDPGSYVDLIVFIIVMLFYPLNMFWRFLAKSRSWWQGGVIGGGLGLLSAFIFFHTAA